jgi:DNA polymerase (family 10)
MVEQGEDLTTIKGIGKGISEKIAEIVRTKTCQALEELKKELPASLLDLLSLEGMGPKKVKLVYEQLGIDSVDKLEAAAKAGKLRDLPGMGAKTEEKLLKAVELFRAGIGRFLLSEGTTVGESALEYMKTIPGIEKIELAGSLRRRKETVGDIDILVTCRDHKAVMDHFVAYPDVGEVLAHGETKSSVRLRSGLQMDCRVVDRESFGAALHYFTGSKSHNVAMRQRGIERNVLINEYGVFERQTEKKVGGAEEADVFRAVGLPWIAPELREDRGELDAAEAGKLPKLVEPEDIRGDLHMHTTASDGANTIEEMAERCKQLGYEYLGIADHSKAVTIANGLDEKRLAKQLKDIDKANDRIKGIRILRSIEVDILGDGSLDLADKVLADCDIVIAAVHFRQKMAPEEMTNRILRAIENPHVDVLAHPTGRLLLERDAFSFDLEKVFASARDAGVFLEVSAHPARLDLKDTHCMLAREIGAKVIINTDSHHQDELYLMRYGVWTARRGWLEKKDVANASPLGAFLKAIRPG